MILRNFKVKVKVKVCSAVPLADAVMCVNELSCASTRLLTKREIKKGSKIIRIVTQASVTDQAKQTPSYSQTFPFPNSF